MSAVHPEHARHVAGDVAFVSDDIHSLSLVKLIPQDAAAAIPARVYAEISVVGDLADGVADLVDATRDHPPRPAGADAPNEIALAITREAACRRKNARRCLVLVPRRRGERDPRRDRAGVREGILRGGRAHTNEGWRDRGQKEDARVNTPARDRYLRQGNRPHVRAS